MLEQEALYKVEPLLIARERGGWLAVTPRGWPLSVGVAAESEEIAIRKFREAMERWASIKLDLTH